MGHTKFWFRISIIAFTILILVFMTAAPGLAADVTATATASKVMVNDKTVAFQAYTIDGYNYFKLRDLALALNGTTKQFQVTWSNGSINISSNTAYTPVGGELDGTTITGSISAAPTASTLYLDGQLLQLTAYSISGNNYFKLRDIGAALNFSVAWQSAANSIQIDTSTGYSAPSTPVDTDYMKEIMLKYPNALRSADQTNIRVGIYDYDTISITKNAANNYDVRLTFTADHLSQDMNALSNVLSVFVSTPDTIIKTLEGLKSPKTADLSIDGKSLHCYTSGLLGVIISW